MNFRTLAGDRTQFCNGRYRGNSLSVQRNGSYARAIINGEGATVSFSHRLGSVSQIEIAVGTGFHSVGAAVFADCERSADTNREAELARTVVSKSQIFRRAGIWWYSLKLESAGICL